jgi:hypothetical protein
MTRSIFDQLENPEAPEPMPVKEQPCTPNKHRWADTADVEGDTCNCGEWYRFKDRIERSPT